METNLIRPSDIVAICGGVAFAFGSIACMMLSVHLARVKDLAGMKSILKLAGGFTLASCCLLAATTYCVVHRCEQYCQLVWLRSCRPVTSVTSDKGCLISAFTPAAGIMSTGDDHITTALRRRFCESALSRL